jgi:hypothetical protein
MERPNLDRAVVDRSADRSTDRSADRGAERADRSLEGPASTFPIAAAFGNELTPQYEQRRDALSPHFAPARQFLLNLEALAASNVGVHLGTRDNVHVYAGQRFLMYVVIKQETSLRPVLAMRAKYNLRIKPGTYDDSASLFDKVLPRTVKALSGFHEGWAVYSDERDEIALMSNTPLKFFDDVIDLLMHEARIRRR